MTIPRDLFDIAVLYESSRRTDLISAMAKYPEKVNAFAEKFRKDMENPRISPYSTTYASSLLPYGKNFIGKEFIICQKFIAEAINKSHCHFI